jgi:FRG domain
MTKPSCNKENRVDNFGSFINALTERHFLTRKIEWVFRGVSNCEYKLIPKVGRENIKSPNISSRVKTEKSMFSLFKRQAHPHLTYHPQNDYEWLTLAQHHGLPTRMLDWSLNPLVALYFAVEKTNGKDGALYALKAGKKLPDEAVKKSNPFEIDKWMQTKQTNGLDKTDNILTSSVSIPQSQGRIYKYLPTLVAKRVAAQEGLFTIHADLTTHLGDCLREGWELERFIIPNSIKDDIRHTLYRLGFHRSSLFQDLDSLANHIEWHHLLDRENNFLD